MTFFIIALLLLPFQENEFEAARIKMVNDQLIAEGITDEFVLDAMRKTERHKFVPYIFRSEAYDDRPLPIGSGQTISQPYIVAYMLELLELEPGDRVLEIGTGSGYGAAVLANIVSEVYTIEIIEQLGERARRRLEKLHYDNVTVKIGDGYKGWKEYAPFDHIIVTAAPEEIPEPLIDQLKNGGRMVIPVGPPDGLQHLLVVEKHDDEITNTYTIPVRFVPFLREDEK